MKVLSLAVLLSVVVVAVAGAKPIYANGGLNPGENVWLAWNLTPEVVVGILGVGWLYIRGLGRWPQPHHPVRQWQRVSFFLGLASIFLALQSPIDPLAEHLFFVHQIQHLLLRMVGPVLLLLGAPMTPLLRGLPVRIRQRAVRPVVRNLGVRKAYRLITNPLIAAVLFIGALYFWQVPPLLNASVRSDALHYVMHATMLATGLLFWWMIIDPKPHRFRMHYGLRALILVLVTTPNTAIGALITHSDQVLYTVYQEAERVTGLAPREDQQIGGLILWIAGDMMNLIVLGVLFFTWATAEQRRQRIDDAKEMARLQGEYAK